MTEHTPFPWTLDRGGGHARPQIVGSGEIQTNGWPEPRGRISNASFSNVVCEFPSSMELPGPAANARLIEAVPILIKALQDIVEHQSAAGGELVMMSVTRRIAKDALKKAGAA